MNSHAEIGKKAAAEAAIACVQSGMLLGLGTGTTVNFFIKSLAEHCHAGLTISAACSSKQTEQLARKLGIPLIDINSLTSLDLTVDGADEIDPQKRMIKGGGGALLREKIIASMSKEMVVIVDAEKCVQTLGSHFSLPVEIVVFAWRATVAHLNKNQLSGKLRVDKNNVPFLTDNGNYIYDISKEALHGNLEALNQTIKSIPGVVETGFFFGLAGRVFVGHSNRDVKLL